MVELNGVRYRYAYNLQGDVIGFVDRARDVVVKYNYYAWEKMRGGNR